MIISKILNWYPNPRVLEQNKFKVQKVHFLRTQKVANRGICWNRRKEEPLHFSKNPSNSSITISISARIDWSCSKAPISSRVKTQFKKATLLFQIQEPSQNCHVIVLKEENFPQIYQLSYKAESENENLQLYKYKKCLSIKNEKYHLQSRALVGTQGVRNNRESTQMYRLTWKARQLIAKSKSKQNLLHYSSHPINLFWGK